MFLNSKLYRLGAVLRRDLKVFLLRKWWIKYLSFPTFNWKNKNKTWTKYSQIIIEKSDNHILMKKHKFAWFFRIIFRFCSFFSASLLKIVHENFLFTRFFHVICFVNNGKIWRSNRRTHGYQNCDYLCSKFLSSSAIDARAEWRKSSMAHLWYKHFVRKLDWFQ